MGFDVNRHPGAICQFAPTLDEGDAFLQPVGTNVGLQVDVVGTEFANQR